MINTDQNTDLVVWDERFVIGVPLIDSQHKELFSLTNELFHACMGEYGSLEGVLEGVFKETMERMVAYVHFHFGAEQVLLERINYPDYHEHKKQHDTLVMKIVESVKEYSEGKKLVPNQFVRILRDWILGHIALYDKLYASYIDTQKKNGLLGDIEING